MRAAVVVIGSTASTVPRPATWRPAPASRSPRSYHHFPSKLGLLTEFLDEAYDITLSRLDRRLDGSRGRRTGWGPRSRR